MASHHRQKLQFLRLFPCVFSLRALLPLSLMLIAPDAFLLVFASSPAILARTLHCFLAMSASRSLPLCVVFCIWCELALPVDFEDSIISHNPHLFCLIPNTHILHLIANPATEDFTPAVEKTWSDKYALKLQFLLGFKPATVKKCCNCIDQSMSRYQQFSKQRDSYTKNTGSGSSQCDDMESSPPSMNAKLAEIAEWSYKENLDLMDDTEIGKLEELLKDVLRLTELRKNQLMTDAASDLRI